MSVPWQTDCPPRYAYRGLALDCVRHFFDAAEVRKILDQMARVKLNVLHWILSNDQGFRVESKRFPKLNAEGEYYTQAEIRDVVAYAAERGIDVLPEINMPGHATAILRAYPDLSCAGKPVERAIGGGVYAVTLCPSKDETARFAEELLEELLPLFPYPYFHIGGDEAPDWEWDRCPCCRAKREALGLASNRELQGEFSNRIIAFLKAHGKTAVLWNDSLEAKNLNTQDIVIQYWSIQYADSTLAFLRSGGKLIYSDMFRLYLDYPPAMTSMEKVYTTDPEIRGETIPAFGLEACLYTEYVSDNALFEQRLLPRIYALGENAWGGERDYADFKTRVQTLIDEAGAEGLSCLPIEAADPEGEAKKAGIMEFMAVMQSGMSPEMREQAVKFTKPNKEFEARFMREFFGREL